MVEVCNDDYNLVVVMVVELDSLVEYTSDAEKLG